MDIDLEKLEKEILEKQAYWSSNKLPEEIEFALKLREINPIIFWSVYKRDDNWDLFEEGKWGYYQFDKTEERIINYVKNYNPCTNIKLK